VVLTGGNASYAFYDENTAGRMLSEADLPAIPETCVAGFFGGISLAVEPCAEAYATLAARMSQAGRLVMLDPNIRPGFIADEARYRARMDRLLSLADIVKVSDEDLAWLMGDGDPARWPRRCGPGPAIVLVTRGRARASRPMAAATGPPPRARGRGRGHGRRGRHVQRGLSGRARMRGACRPMRCARACPTEALVHGARPGCARRRRHRVARGRQPAARDELP
jgi:hypothetical protein